MELAIAAPSGLSMRCVNCLGDCGVNQKELYLRPRQKSKVKDLDLMMNESLSTEN
jgi:hypothetical protein